jgi:hypothetical protein
MHRTELLAEIVCVRITFAIAVAVSTSEHSAQAVNVVLSLSLSRCTHSPPPLFFANNTQSMDCISLIAGLLVCYGALHRETTTTN